jgi:hypothetical protein
MLFKEPNEAASALDPATNSPKPLARIATARKLDFDMAKILKISTTDMPNAGTGYRFLFVGAPEMVGKHVTFDDETGQATGYSNPPRRMCS